MEPLRQERVPRWLAAVAGIASAAVGLATAEVAAGADRRFRSPVLGVADRVVDNVPAPVKEFGIAVFGTGDKVALLVGVGVVLLVYATGVGIVAYRRSRTIALLGIGLFSVVGFVASAASRTGFEALAGVPALIGGLGAAAVLDRLVVLSHSSRTLDEAMGAGEADGPLGQSSMTRRRVLAGSSAAVAAAVVLAATGRRLGGRFNPSSARGRHRASDGRPPSSTDRTGGAGAGSCAVRDPERQLLPD